MFCKFCGQNIPDTSEFCPECGKKLKKEEPKEKADRRPINTPLALMLIILCWSTVRAWGQVLLFGYQAHIGMLISTVMLVVGLVLLGTMIGRERIYAETYRFSDLLVLCCVWMVVPALMWRWESYVMYHIVGQYANSAWLTWGNGAHAAIQFPAFWLVLGLIALGLARSGEWKPTKKQKTILLAALLLRSVLGFVFAIVTAVGMGAPMEVIDMTVNMTRQWTLLCWLWPLLILRVFCRLGSGEICPAGAAAALVGMQLGEVFLLPIFAALFDLGVSGCALANGLAPLFGLLILCVATRLHKKKTVDVI